MIEICDSGKIVNGLTLAPGKKFNGFDDLACSIVFELKGETGNGRVYLHAEKDYGECGEDYLYEIIENPDGDGKPMILVENMDGELEEVQDILERVSNV